jgi:hypothetical protein
VAICGAGGRPTSRVDHDVKPISFFLKRQMIKKPYMLYADRHMAAGGKTFCPARVLDHATSAFRPDVFKEIGLCRISASY